MDKPFKSRLDDALDAAALAFKTRIGVMSRHTLSNILHPFGDDVAEAAIVTLEGACMRAKFAQRGVPTGRDLLQFDPECETKLRHHRAVRDSALAQKAIANRLLQLDFDRAERRRDEIIAQAQTAAWRTFGASVARTKVAASVRPVEIGGKRQNAPGGRKAAKTGERGSESARACSISQTENILPPRLLGASK